MAEMSLYRYTIEMRYTIDKIETVIDSSHIHYIMIDYDYDFSNMPIILSKVAIDKNMLDHMINNKNPKITFIVKKYLKDVYPRIEEDYIKGEFIYFFTNEINSRKDLDYNKSNTREDIFEIVDIGLMSEEMINSNKYIINGIINNVPLISVLTGILGNRSMVIEEPRNRNVNMIVPPITTRASFISYLNDNYILYDTTYRFFYDFNKTYLVSSSGKPIPDNNYINSIIFDIRNTAKIDAKEQGMEINNKNKVYNIPVDRSNISILNDKISQRSYNSIITVDDTGEYNKADLTTTVTAANNISKIQRLTSNNLEIVNNLKSSIDNNLTGINIVKQELDNSIFTINKEYVINNYSEMKEYNGKYILSRKREIFQRDNDTFLSTIILTMRKLIS